jgi:hypothetical protein
MMIVCPEIGAWWARWLTWHPAAREISPALRLSADAEE